MEMKLSWTNAIGTRIRVICRIPVLDYQGLSCTLMVMDHFWIGVTRSSYFPIYLFQIGWFYLLWEPSD
jgi:hypothetical protein